MHQNPNNNETPELPVQHIKRGTPLLRLPFLCSLINLLCLSVCLPSLYLPCLPRVLSVKRMAQPAGEA